MPGPIIVPVPVPVPMLSLITQVLLIRFLWNFQGMTSRIRPTILNHKIPIFFFSFTFFQSHNFFTLSNFAWFYLVIAIIRERVVVAILVRKQGQLKLWFWGDLVFWQELLGHTILQLSRSSQINCKPELLFIPPCLWPDLL